MQYTNEDVYEYIAQYTDNTILERRTCEISGARFPVFQSDMDFYAKMSPRFNGTVFSVPPPRLCPEEMQRRRMSFRNERKLYRRKCDASKKSIISAYSPNKPYKVYDQDIWWSDQWDPLDYGRDFDFSKTATENFKALLLDVPKLSLHNKQCENSYYCNISIYNKDCYLIFGSTHCESCQYSSWIEYCTDVFDGLSVYSSSHCYECISTTSSHNCFYCYDIKDCAASRYLRHCNSCDHCLFCVGLTNKKYHIFNEAVSKGYYEDYLAKLISDANLLQTTTKKYEALQRENIVPATDMVQSSTSLGDRLNQVKECVYCFDTNNCEGLRYCSFMKEDAQDSHACTWVMTSSRQYQCVSSANQYACIAANFCRDSSNTYYSAFCNNCNDILLCNALRHKQYAILNKVYTQQEYEALAARIVGHMQETGEWGMYFDPSLSAFGYNETKAHEYYTSSQTEVEQAGYKWEERSYDPSLPEDTEILVGDAIPYDIEHVTDDMLGKVIVCEVSGRPFKIQKKDLIFYRKHKLPLPRRHPDVRHQDRLDATPGHVMYLRDCDSTHEKMLSVYPADVPFKVYTHDAYQQHKFG